MIESGNGGPAPEWMDAPGPRRALGFLDVLLACAVTSSLILIPFIALLGFTARRQGLDGEAASLATLGLLMLEPVAIIGGVYSVLIAWRRFTWADFGFRPARIRWAAPAVLGALGCLAFAGAVTPLFDRYYDTSMLDEYLALFAPGGFTWQRAALLTVIVGGLVPLAEETLFRGVIYAWLRQRWGTAVSAVISAGLFALAHANLRMALQIFVTGIVLAVLYERSRSIFVSTLAHMTVNTISLVIIFSYAA
jgi:membrane protease YdiL (CAAX protease family)